MSIIAAIIKVKQAEYDTRRGLFFEENSTCYLIKRDGDAHDFSVVQKIISGWYLEYSDLRGQFELLIATDQSNFGSQIAFSDAVAVNDEVYEIAQGDSLPPNGNNLIWKLRCERTGEKFKPTL